MLLPRKRCSEIIRDLILLKKLALFVQPILLSCRKAGRFPALGQLILIPDREIAKRPKKERFATHLLIGILLLTLLCAFSQACASSTNCRSRRKTHFSNSSSWSAVKPGSVSFLVRASRKDCLSRHSDIGFVNRFSILQKASRAHLRYWIIQLQKRVRSSKVCARDCGLGTMSRRHGMANKMNPMMTSRLTKGWLAGRLRRSGVIF
jgi:hypothetical protein